MRILMAGPNRLTPELGAAKVLLELAAALREHGCTCDVIGPEELGASAPTDLRTRRDFARRLARRFSERAGDYDVFDYDHLYLPFARNEFPAEALMIARSVLLTQHAQTIVPPRRRSVRSAIGRIVREPRRRRALQACVRMADECVAHADLVNVSNDHDKAELVRRGVAGEKVVVLPFGLSAERRRQFEASCGESPPAEPVVAFVGTFDWRKGAADFPRLFTRIVEGVPRTRLRLLGTRGLFRTADDVLAHFPRAVRSRIDVVPHFPSERLPALLADCSVGVFPSYYEGFGFGVLEMLAAAIPVVAYDAPGPPMMLPAKYLVRPGDVDAMAQEVVCLLRDSQRLAQARRDARERSQPFVWSQIARRTIDVYRDALTRRRNASVPTP